jgi:hypothetical protein
MQIIEDVFSEKEYIEKCIEKNGNSPEHNFLYFVENASKTIKPIFFDFGNNRGIMALLYPTYCKFLSEPVTLENKAEMVVEAIKSIPKGNVNKVMLELKEDTTNGVKKLLPKEYFARKPTYIYNWPVYNLKKFDPKLGGIPWKKLRNIKNNFEKNHKIEIVDARTVDKKLLIEIFEDWIKNRNGEDRIEKERHVNAIDNNFAGYDIIKCLIVDGKPCTISGGWNVRGRKMFYSSFGTLNYAHKYLGEYSIISEMIMMKNLGYEYIDFGGCDGNLLNFKLKFKPEYVYKTIEFCVARASGGN